MASRIHLFKDTQLKPVWTFNAGALIWRIFFTPHNLLIGETRDQEEKSTRFFCLDIPTGRVRWQDIGFEEPWWIGIEAVHEPWLILHGYVRPDVPEHRGIRVLDIESGKLLWRNDERSFWFIDGEQLYAHTYLFEKHICTVMDINTGELVSEQSENLDAMQELRQQTLQKESERQPAVMFPDVYDEHEADPALRKTIQRLTDNKALEGWIEFLDHRGILIVSYYRKEEKTADPPLLDNRISIYDKQNEKILYTDIIAGGVKTPSPDTFFIKDDLLLFLKHQTSILALQPWKS